MLSLRLLFGASLALACSLAGAQVALKPQGEDTQLLRVKGLKADVQIEAQVATTRLEITFQNTLSKRIEADFIYAVPNHTLVTSFAYWFGEEKVIARVVEKERAAAIYKHITDRMRDPALIEMIGKRAFRAKIFPVMPNADLKVEMTLIQVLPSAGQGYSYTLPLKMEKGDFLENLDVQVQVKQDAWIENVQNNLGLVGVASGNTNTFTQTAKNYRPQKDLRVTITRRDRPLQASLFSARSGGRDGFFALTLTAPKALISPKISISGVKVYDLRPGKLPNVRAGQALTVYGRYSGVEAGRVTLTAKGYKDEVEVWFSDQAIPNNAATKLWANAEIERLSTSEKNRGKIIALSTRHTIPSKFTSWLAIPQEELARYKREKLLADMEPLAQRLVQRIKQGRENSPEAQQLFAKLVKMGKEAEYSHEHVLSEYLYDYVGSFADRLAKEITEGRPSSTRANQARRRLNQLKKFGSQAVTNAINSSTAQYTYEIAGDLSKEIIANRESSAKAKKLRNKLDLLARDAGTNANEYLRGHLQGQVYELEREVVRLELAEEQDRAKISSLRAKITRLERASGMEHGETHDQVWDSELSQQVNGAMTNLAKEIRAGRGKSPQAAKLRSQVADLRGKFKNRANATESNSYHHLAAELYPLAQTLAKEALAGRGSGEAAQGAKRKFEEITQEFGIDGKQALAEAVRTAYGYRDYDLMQEKQKTILDREKIALLENEVSQISQAIGVTPEFFLDRVDGWYDDPESSTRHKLILERRKDQPDQARIKELEEQLRLFTAERRSDSYARDRISRIAVEVDLDKLQLLTLTPELTDRKRQLEERQRQLRARMGDPLISVQAPQNAQQVVAVMPDGVLKQFEFNQTSKAWECRFDIPTYASEGAYVVKVIVVMPDGTRKEQTFTYHVDVTPPKAQATAQLVEGKLRIEVAASIDTARVDAILPWGDMVRLERTPKQGVFFLIVDVPISQQNQLFGIELIVTDKAHNRTNLKLAATRP